jgi:hypothetical protein
VVKKLVESEPQILNKPVMKIVDETTMKIHFDVLQLRKRLPLHERELLEELERIVRHHKKYGKICVVLRTGGFMVGDFAVNRFYKVLVADIEITLCDVEKVWSGFDWEVKSFRGLKVERVIKVV